jgi:hypothetical protein
LVRVRRSEITNSCELARGERPSYCSLGTKVINRGNMREGKGDEG